MEAKLLFIQALSPLHAGTGQGTGVVDLPIAREKATSIPYLPGSSLKGIFRQACPDEHLRTRVFGPGTNAAHEHSGAVTFTDARLLLLSVRSLRGVFAWVTSPLLLRRLLRDAISVNGSKWPTSIPQPAAAESCVLAAEDGEIVLSDGEVRQVVLDELVLAPDSSDDAADWADQLSKVLYPQDEGWQTAFRSRFCVVPDDVLAYLQETAMEITPRIRLHEEKKVVEGQALWYEEALPVETVLVGLVIGASVGTTQTSPQEVFDAVSPLTGEVLQFGGNATVGRGLCRTTLVTEGPS